MLKGRLLKRYKRFLADVELPGGEVVTAHCPNSGSMKNLIEESPTVYLSRHDDPKRKLPYTLELIETNGYLAAVYAAKANTLVTEAIKAGIVPELQGYDILRTEIPYGTGSRIDILLEKKSERCWVEVKSVTLLEGEVLSFPDSVTTRGQKHLDELMAVKISGERAVIFFAALHTGGSRFSPAAHIDKRYADLLQSAIEQGVEALCYQATISLEEIHLSKKLEIHL